MRHPTEQPPQRNYAGDSPDLEKLCIHGIPRNGSAVSTRHPTLQHPYEYQGDVIANSTPYAQAPTDAPTRARISFFLFTSDKFCKRPVSSYQDSYFNFLQGDLQAKVVPETDYLSRFLRSHARVPQASLQADLSQSRSLRIPEEQDDHKKRDVEQSAPTHARHTHCTPMQLGTTAD